MSSPNFFDVVLFFLQSLVTSPSFMSISYLALELWWFSCIKDWPESGNRKYLFDCKCLNNESCLMKEAKNTPVWVFSNIWRLGWVRDTKFGMDVSNEMLLNATKYRGYSFYRFWVITEKPTGGKITSPPPPLSQITVKINKSEKKCTFSLKMSQIASERR